MSPRARGLSEVSSHTLPPLWQAPLGEHEWMRPKYHLPHLSWFYKNLPVEELQGELRGQETKHERGLVVLGDQGIGSFETWSHHHLPRPVFPLGKAASGCLCNLPQVTQLISCPDHYWKWGQCWLENLDPSLTMRSPWDVMDEHRPRSPRGRAQDTGGGAPRSGCVHVEHSHQTPFSPKLNCLYKAQKT